MAFGASTSTLIGGLGLRLGSAVKMTGSGRWGKASPVSSTGAGGTLPRQVR